MKTDIDEKFKEKIDASTIIEAFEGLITQCIKVLIRNLSIKLTHDSYGPNLRNIVMANWASFESVGDQSDYVVTVQNELFDTMTLFRNAIAEEHFTFLSDSIAKATIKLFEDQIYLIRGISEFGAEQLLVDATSIKGLIAKMPHIGLSDDEASKINKERFVKRIDKEMAPVEKLLKLLMTPKEALVVTYKTLYHQSMDPLHFIKILNIKGVPRTEQGTYLEQYGLKANDPIRLNLKNQSEEQQPKRMIDFDAVFKSIDFDSMFNKKKDG